MKKVLIVGASGFLGSQVLSRFEKNYQVIGTYSSKSMAGSKGLIHLDATNNRQLEAFLEMHKFNIVINCAGLTNVDECEIRPEAAFILNTISAMNLANASNRFAERLIHISTDHYQSVHDEPRDENNKVWAINQYGNSKILAEQIVLEANPNTVVIRTNFFGTKIDRLSLLDQIVSSVFDLNPFDGFYDVHFSPVSVSFLAEALILITESAFCGILNISSNESVSKFEFATLVTKSLDFDPTILVKRTSIVEKHLKAKRPNYLSLDNGLLKSLSLLTVPPIEDMIDGVLRSERFIESYGTRG